MYVKVFYDIETMFAKLEYAELKLEKLKGKLSISYCKNSPAHTNKLWIVCLLFKGILRSYRTRLNECPCWIDRKYSALFCKFQKKPRQNIGQRKLNVCMKVELSNMMKSIVNSGTNGSEHISLL